MTTREEAKRKQRASLDRSILKQADLEKAGSLAIFIRMAWPLVEPAVKLRWNWHIDMICAHLEAVSRGEIKRLIINIPPGCMKSLMVSVFWPLWEWTQRPETAWMYASFDKSLTIKQANQVRAVIDSDWFQERWGCKAELSESEKRAHEELKRVVYNAAQTDSASEFTLTEGGYRFSTSVQGKGTGRHVDIQVVDDPLKPADTKGTTKAIGSKLKDCNVWWSETMSSRHRDPSTFRRVIIMQRLHEADLAGTQLETGEYIHVMLPMEFEPSRRCVTPWGADPRTKEGELLWPARFDANWCRFQKSAAGMGDRTYSAQCQQRPAPAGGSIFKTEFRKHWNPGQLTHVINKLQLIQSWDCTFKDNDDSDYVAGGIIGICGADFYVLDGYMAKTTMTGTCAAIEAFRAKWKRAYSIVIEDAANGRGVVDTLQKRISGLILVSPQGGKVARANAVEPFWSAGNIWLPPLTEENAQWLKPMMHQIEFFPYAANDDMVDMMTQGVLHLYGKDTTGYAEGVKAMLENLNIEMG